MPRRMIVFSTIIPLRIGLSCHMPSFWLMTQLMCFKSKPKKEKFFLLLRQYQEEKHDAFLLAEDLNPRILAAPSLEGL